MDPQDPQIEATEPAPGTAAAAWRALRPHQWAKNLLVFVPLLAAHRFDRAAVLAVAAMFVAFGLAASAAYLVNDVADADADRRHPRKRWRPVASGALAPRSALAGAVVLALAALAFTWLVLPPAATVALAAYLAGSTVYTCFLRRRVVADIAALAILYTLRIVGGAAALAIVPSPWLLALSLALFANLALVKRRAELALAGPVAGTLPGRGYGARHIRALGRAGAITAIAAAAILVGYAASFTGSRHYARPELLALLAPLLVAWLARAWTRARDGRMHDDPVVDASRDAAGLVLVAAGFVVFYAAI